MLIIFKPLKGTLEALIIKRVELLRELILVCQCFYKIVDLAQCKCALVKPAIKVDAKHFLTSYSPLPPPVCAPVCAVASAADELLSCREEDLQYGLHYRAVARSAFGNPRELVLDLCLTCPSSHQ